ncbi:hypothetical protein AVEN_80607-1 [Araneus ventricosus]|uniref:Uncharacterized protein n=1 Tax=Araneus ventricosus TaxID=182803 RepID=A0A4Y2KAE6_ARAVE|nr:hypothetical protein AVEN_80607-1 [Araneus ventricosus]
MMALYASRYELKYLSFLSTMAVRSPDLNPCDFWLWGYPERCCIPVLDCSLAELKVRIRNTHSKEVTPETLRSIVEPISRFQLFCRKRWTAR